MHLLSVMSLNFLIYASRTSERTRISRQCVVDETACEVFFPNVNLTLFLPLFRFYIHIQINKPFDPEKSLFLRNINFFLVTGSTLTSKILLKYKIGHRTIQQLPFSRGRRDGEAPRRESKSAFALRSCLAQKRDQ